MKKALSLLAAVALIAAASTAMASTISATKHNLSSTNPNATYLYKGTGTQICVFCHTPHNAFTTAPLWNRQAGATAASAYKLYSGLNMTNQSFKSGFSAQSVSLFCMSCHDGASQLGGNMIKNVPSTEPAGLGLSIPMQANTKAAIATYGDGTGNGGNDLRTTHPVNFVVAAGVNTQSDLVPVGVGSMGRAGGTAFPLFKSDRAVAGSQTNTLECSSCHSVHDNANAPFLRDTQTGSKLCLGCHDK